jgi:hypothetical protein
MLVEIVRRPEGEAPDWVRDAWIGLLLPTTEESPDFWRGFGVLTGPTTVLRQLWALVTGQTVRVSGYTVNAKVTVDLLAEIRPAAADWWKAHPPRLLDGRRHFVFDHAACERQS